MAYYTHTKDPVGAFQEKDTGNWFEWSINNDVLNNINEDFPHKVWTGGAGVCGDQGYRLSLIHISEPTRLRRNSYAVFCLKKKKNKKIKKDKKYSHHI